MPAVLPIYAAQRLVGRDTPSLDRLVAVLDENPGASREDLMRLLTLSYVGVVDVVGRGIEAGWVKAELTRRAGRRSTWTYRTAVPDGAKR